MGGRSTTTTESKPLPHAMPLLERSAKDIMAIYNDGQATMPYLGQTVAPLSKVTRRGVGELAQAGQAWDTAGTRSLYKKLGAGAVSNPYMSNLDEMASGKWLEQGNPYFNARLEQTLDDTSAQVRSAMSGMGRGASGAETRELTDRLGGIRNTALADDWDRNLSAMLGANQTAGGLYATGIGQAQAAADSMAGLDQRNFENRLAGAGATLQAGDILDTQGQKHLTDKVNKYYALATKPLTDVGLLQAGAAGSTGNYGTQVSQQRTSPGIGGILSGIGGVKG